MIHTTKSKLANKTVLLKPNVDRFGGMKVKIEDWFDRVTGMSWKESDGNPACILYAVRTMMSSYDVPSDDNVLYGKINRLGILIHLTEIDERSI